MDLYEVEQHIGECMPETEYDPVMPWILNREIDRPDRMDPAELMGWYNKLDISNAGDLQLSKIIYTINCKTSSELLEQLLTSKATLVCIDSTRYSITEMEECINTLNKALSNVKNCGIKIMVSIALEVGFKFRTGNIDKMLRRKVILYKNDSVCLTSDPVFKNHCTADIIYVNYDFFSRLYPGYQIHIGFNNIILEIARIKQKCCECLVYKGGILKSNAIVNGPGCPRPPCYTEDMNEIFEFAERKGVTDIIIAYTKNRSEIENIKNSLESNNKKFRIWAKIEDYNGIHDFENIISVANAAVFSNISLSFEMSSTNMMWHMKRIVKKCNELGKPIYLMSLPEYLTTSNFPSYSECVEIKMSIDIGIDGFILPEKFLSGPNPFVTTMYLKQACIEAERLAAVQNAEKRGVPKSPETFSQATMALAFSAVQAAFNMKCVAIICVTSTGRTAEYLSRFKPDCPIFAVTTCDYTVKKLNYSRAVFPLKYSDKKTRPLDDFHQKVAFAMNYARSIGFMKSGDQIVVISSTGECDRNATLRIMYASYLTEHGNPPRILIAPKNNV